ncbi:transposable element Tcb2 transposase [Trichonephila clavipes]|nr:transposable element Tcb2 transposase [Trichonephila clavipes]
MPCCCLQEEEFLGVPLTPPERVTRFPRLEEGNVPINTSWYGMFLGISRVLGKSWTARRYPSADSRPIRKADCVSKKNPLQNTESRCRNCGGGDRGRVAIYRPFGELRRAKIVLSPVWCSRPTTGVPLAHATMNFVGLDLTASDRYLQQWVSQFQRKERTNALDILYAQKPVRSVPFTADAARRLNVSQRLWDQYQSEDSVSRRPVPSRPRATTPAEDRFLALSARRRRTTTVPQLVADHCQASGRRISATTVRNRLHNAGLYARRPVVRLLIWREQRTRYHQSNTVERHSYRGGGILVWAGISLGGHTDLHVFHGGTVTGLRYRDEILDPYVRPHAAAIGNDFILMDDNARSHRARIVEEYLEDHGLERMELSARSPDLNPLEHLWDYLGRGCCFKSSSSKVVT